MSTTDRAASADQISIRQPTAGSTHMQRPTPSDLDGEATDCAEELAREDALRHSSVRAPR